MRRFLFAAACALTLAACGGTDKKSPDAVDGAGAPDAVADDAAPETVENDLSPADLPPDVPTGDYPDPAFVHKLDGDAAVAAGDEYPMDEAFQYRTAQQLPSLDVRALSLAGGKVWAGTADGLYHLDPEAEAFVPLPPGDGEVTDITDMALALDGAKQLAVVAGGKLYRVATETGAVGTIGSPEGVEFTAVAADGGYLWLGTQAHGLWFLNLAGEPLEPVQVVAEDFPVRDLLVDAGGNVWLATPAGVRRYAADAFTDFDMVGGFLPDDDVRALAFDAETNALFAGTALGISRLSGDSAKLLTAGLDKLPHDHVQALAMAGGRLALGHDIGATVVADPLAGDAWFSRFDHYVSGRWLPSDAVRDVAIDGEGRVWVATAAGISRIEWVEHTFAEKAAFMEELLDAHFWRMDGFVSSDVVADDAWAPQSWHVYDKDNDGLWTQMQIGAWCYAYAATGDESYYQKARKAMDVMMLQVDIPAVDFEAAGLGRGFVTRSLVRDDEGDVFASKATQDNWHLVHWTDGHDYYWKDDTSSDEIDGHFYGYPLFYDLCAKTDEERQEVASYAAAITAYIIDHDYVLIDLDGEKTFHGHWSPALIGAAAEGIDKCLEEAKKETDMGKLFELTAACYESWGGGGWLNGTEIIGTLLATWHMTGDVRFYDEYEKLLTEHHYDQLLMPHDETLTITSPAIMNHSDHELAMLAYHTLIRYEPNDERREKWVEGLLFLYEHEKIERNPLWAAFVALLAGPEHAILEPALQSLREMPFDRREWHVSNSHRKDALEWPDDRHGDPQFDRVFAYDEIRTIWWNGNFHVQEGGGNPKEFSGPMAWLLPYYALRYAGLISE